ncbi:MAG: hypothetical protein GTO51_02360 [Candidatus Latescibacteria bacterium]|nr:hypothetical protein [Candidatus Latescibacterota bacterium]NIM22503.1 hypothetical protein [Candidatus Latescibacterota bacterium]NIM64817.1 hypothetical protein [Candidatus Latescibacterota bacterium]NIO01325.1 hypothetical protein [Candidatus Latescibacterota bacterium]NIO27814.1 hypothetical protein [Candidatus Latescibacterota bacterium]
MPVEKNPAPDPHSEPSKAVFDFEGRSLEGIAGEPIAKSLFRAGIRILSYSVKYHRPRGIHCGRGRCGMCHMEVDGIPGIPTCNTPLENGMKIRRQDFRPFFAPVLTAAARRFPLPAGFYYRRFTKPVFLKNLFMDSLRKMAGVGRVTLDEEERLAGIIPDCLGTFDRIKPHYDVIVVGAGLSGMSAALSAASSVSGKRGDASGPQRNEAEQDNMRILLMDEYPNPGGHSIGHQDDSGLLNKRDDLAREVAEHPLIHVASGTLAQGFYPPSTILIAPTGGSIASAQGMKQVTARAFIFATGAYDIIPLFENNELPGIFGSRAARLFLERDGYSLGKTAAVYGTGAELERTVSLLLSKSIDITAVVEAGANPRETPARGSVPESVQRISNAHLVSANGKRWIDSATLITEAGRGERITLRCNMLCTAFRGQPAYELPHQAKFNFSLSDDVLDEERIMIPDEVERRDATGTACILAGEAAGETNWRRKIEQGKEAGEKAANAASAIKETGEKA